MYIDIKKKKNEKTKQLNIVTTQSYFFLFIFVIGLT